MYEAGLLPPAIPCEAMVVCDPLSVPCACIRMCLLFVEVVVFILPYLLPTEGFLVVIVCPERDCPFFLHPMFLHPCLLDCLVGDYYDSVAYAAYSYQSNDQFVLPCS